LHSTYIPEDDRDNIDNDDDDGSAIGDVNTSDTLGKVHPDLSNEQMIFPTISYENINKLVKKKNQETNNYRM
jgi:hypothetical protein